MNNFQYLAEKTDGENCHWITITSPETEADSERMSITLLNELKSALDTIAADPAIKGLIIQARITDDTQSAHEKLNSDLNSTDTDANLNSNTNSGKRRPATPKETLQTVTLTQHVLQLLTTLSQPSVVILDRLTPWYGISLAMATSYCIASDDSKNALGFIAAKLGTHPDIITTQNTIRRLGTSAAMDYLLTGNTLSPQFAVEKGLIDACVPAAKLTEAAKTLLRKRPHLQRAGFAQQLSALIPSRLLTGVNISNKAQQIGLPQHYPAPYALARLWKKYGMSSAAVAQDAYASSITTLSQTNQARNLTQVARLEKKLCPAHSGPEQNPLTHPTEHSIKRIHIIGSGMTAGDIATYLLIRGLNVSLQDKQPEAVGQTVEVIKQNLAEQYAYRADQITTLLTNLTLGQGSIAVQQAELILVLKGSHLAENQEIFAGLEENARPDAILAAHSTTLPLNKIAAALLNPQRLIGIHFCYPAFKMPLTEVSSTDSTAPELLAQTSAILCQLGKLPLQMKNSPGLLVDRILIQYIIQGIRLNQQGVPHTIIDNAGRDTGMPHGPLELADKLGLDYCLRVAEVLERANKINIPYQLIDMVKTGKLGIKSGTGFYRYRNGNRLKADRIEWKGSKQALKEKLTGQIREEAAMCLEEGLVEDPDLIDAGVIFGTGLAPYLGGPLYQQRHHQTQNIRAPL